MDRLRALEVCVPAANPSDTSIGTKLWERPYLCLNREEKGDTSWITISWMNSDFSWLITKALLASPAASYGEEIHSWKEVVSKVPSFYLRCHLSPVVVQISKSTTWTETVMTSLFFLSWSPFSKKTVPVNTYSSMFLFSCIFEYDKLFYPEITLCAYKILFDVYVPKNNTWMKCSKQQTTASWGSNGCSTVSSSKILFYKWYNIAESASSFTALLCCVLFVRVPLMMLGCKACVISWLI